MRRQSVILAAFFALFLTTFSPIRATAAPQEDANAGIMMLSSTSGQAFTSLEAYARDCWNKTTLLEGQEVTYYELGLVDLPDPGSYDCWLWAGGLIQQTTTSGGTVSKGGALFQGVVIRLPNGNWASPVGLASANIASGNWPVYFRVNGSSFVGATFYGSYQNTGDITVQDAANFMTNLRSFLVAVKNLAITGAIVNDLDVARLNDFETYDTDGGGVIDLVEWVRGGDITSWLDDVPANDVDCLCGACCSCECVCGKWGGAVCDETNGEDGCDCHKTDDPENPDEEECACANYCCYHTCECEKCADLPADKHSQHKNGSPTCDETDGEDGCNCHKTDDPENPDEEECTCAKYCYYHTCECEKCADLPADKHSQHKNGSPTCDETDGEDGCDCHKTDDPENPDDEECTCANYCCYHTCECKRCASLPAASHSQHKNGSPTCNGTTGSGGCACHATTGEENDKVELPEAHDYEVPEEKQKDSFLPSSDLNDAFGRLKSKIAQKFGLEKLSNLLGGDLSGKLPSWSFQIPPPIGGTVVLDLNKLLDYEFVTLFRCVLVFWVYYFTAITVFNSLRRLL